MRYAIVSDIHANWQAWSAVRNDFINHGVDCVLCLGDVIGYGPSPQRVLDDLRTYCDNFVLGNHDAVACGKVDPDLFNDRARFAIDWTCDQLDNDAARFFGKVPMTMGDGNLFCVHAEAAVPERWSYLFGPEDARPSFEAVDDPMIFVGHTHRPLVCTYAEGDVSAHLCPDALKLDPGFRYLVNVGSVGDPRDGIPTASYVIYDSDSQLLQSRRLAFDYATFRRDLERSRLPIRPVFLDYLDEVSSAQTQLIELADMALDDTAEVPAIPKRPGPAKIKIKHSAPARKTAATTSPHRKQPRSDVKLWFVAAAAALVVLGLFFANRAQRNQQAKPAVAATQTHTPAPARTQPSPTRAVPNKPIPLSRNPSATQPPASATAQRPPTAPSKLVATSGRSALVAATPKPTATTPVRQPTSRPMPPPSHMAPGFIPDPSKKYYVDCPSVDARLSGKGPTGNAYGETYHMPKSVSRDTTGPDVEWQFVPNGDRWHLQMVGGGDLSRLWAVKVLGGVVMTHTGRDGGWTQFAITETGGGSCYLTAPDGPPGFKRLGLFGGGGVKCGNANAGAPNFQLVITEVGAPPPAQPTAQARNPVPDSPIAKVAGLFLDGNFSAARAAAAKADPATEQLLARVVTGHRRLVESFTADRGKLVDVKFPTEVQKLKIIEVNGSKVTATRRLDNGSFNNSFSAGSVHWHEQVRRLGPDDPATALYVGTLALRSNNRTEALARFRKSDSLLGRAIVAELQRSP